MIVGTSTSCSTSCGTGSSRRGTRGLRRRSAARCAAVPVQVAPAAHPDRVAGNPGGEHLPERSRVVRLALPLPVLAVLGPCGALWCWYVARTAATVCCSCRHHERRRRSLRRFAATIAINLTRSTARLIHYSNTQKMVTRKPFRAWWWLWWLWF